MVHLGKIYTRTGDQGKTSLVSGERVSKCAPRIEAFGEIDELNSALGVLRTCAEHSDDATVRDASRECFCQVQNDLFDIGSLLAAAPGSEFADSASFRSEATSQLEQCLDAFNQDLPELTSFVLPGGCELNAHAHVARTVCRRAERQLWRLHAQEPVDAAVLQYMNRLSDLLFVYARWVSKALGAEEYLWVPSLKRD